MTENSALMKVQAVGTRYRQHQVMCPKGKDLAWVVHEPVEGPPSTLTPPRMPATDTVSDSYRPETKFASISRHSDSFPYLTERWGRGPNNMIK